MSAHGRNRKAAPSRRDLLRMASRGTVAGAAISSLGAAGLLEAATRTAGGYKALVVLYLAGGNDSFNMVVPTNASAYDDYEAARQNLAVPLGDLQPIAPATPDGNTYGMHPLLPGFKSLFDSGKLAVTANVGNLVRPTTKAQYGAGSVPLPPRLFSHSDQQSQSMRVASNDATSRGWGGALADATVGMNGGSPLNPGITLAGSTPHLIGAATRAYHLGASGSVALGGFDGPTGQALGGTFDLLRQQSQSHPMSQQFASTRDEAIEIDALISSALDVAAPLQTTFPSGSSAAAQLRMVARMIGIQGALGLQRQVFFVKIGGFDTHTAQLADQPALFTDVDTSVAAFQAAMAELGMENQVTLSVVSEFGRTLSSNGQGTDHGWGGHFLTIGGDVRGGDIYGAMPSFELNGVDDSGAGRMIPTTATDQYAATLARWFGVPDAELGLVFPNLPAFAATHLGFMG